MNKRIRVIIYGGNIQNITGIPEGYVVDVMDYDCDSDDDGLELDSIGDPVRRSEWYPTRP